MARSRHRRTIRLKSGLPAGLDAFRRHGGTHQDQYRTAKQARLDGRREAAERAREADEG